MNNLNLFFRELLPPVAMWRIEARKRREAESVTSPKWAEYFTLETRILEKRLAEEHSRSQRIDDKTAKFNLGLTLCLTVLGVAAVTTANLLPDHILKPLIVLLLSLSSVYMLMGGMVSLTAFKLETTYGFGTLFEIRKIQYGRAEVARALIGQESMNQIKQVRSQVAYLCLRNGFALLLTALLLVFATLTLDAYQSSPMLIEWIRQALV